MLSIQSLFRSRPALPPEPVSERDWLPQIEEIGRELSAGEISAENAFSSLETVFRDVFGNTSEEEQFKALKECFRIWEQAAKSENYKGSGGAIARQGGAGFINFSPAYEAASYMRKAAETLPENAFGYRQMAYDHINAYLDHEYQMGNIGIRDVASRKLRTACSLLSEKKITQEKEAIEDLLWEAVSQNKMTVCDFIGGIDDLYFDGYAYLSEEPFSRIQKKAHTLHEAGTLDLAQKMNLLIYSYAEKRNKQPDTFKNLFSEIRTYWEQGVLSDEDTATLMRRAVYFDTWSDSEINLQEDKYVEEHADWTLRQEMLDWSCARAGQIRSYPEDSDLAVGLTRIFALSITDQFENDDVSVLVIGNDNIQYPKICTIFKKASSAGQDEKKEGALTVIFCNPTCQRRKTLINSPEAFLEQIRGIDIEKVGNSHLMSGEEFKQLESFLDSYIRANPC